MDKNQVPKRRASKPLNLFKRQIFVSDRYKADMERQKRYRKKDGNWFANIFKTFRKAWNYIGDWFGTSVSRRGIKREKRYPRWMQKRIARNRRRRELGNISRRVNR